MSTQITYEYYCILCSTGGRHKAQAVLRHNGTFTYFTYHLIA